MTAPLNKKAATVAGAQYTNNSPLEASEVRFAAQGQWPLIYSSTVIPVHSKPIKHTSCSGCVGVDRFRFLKNWILHGNYYCSGGGDPTSGDGFSLLMHVHGWTFPEALMAVADVLGIGSNMDESERILIRKKAEKAQQKIQDEIQNRNQLMNDDAYILDCVFNLESAVKDRSATRATEYSSLEHLCS